MQEYAAKLSNAVAKRAIRQRLRKSRKRDEERKLNSLKNDKALNFQAISKRFETKVNIAFRLVNQQFVFLIP